MQDAFAGADTWSNRHRIRDYALTGKRLFLQRLVIYSAAITLAGFYYDWSVALTFYALVAAVEAYDTSVFTKILKSDKLDSEDISRGMSLIYIGTALSSGVISCFAIFFAILQGPYSGHFLPLFILFSAAVFAAINNRHFTGVLVLRLSIYTAAILFIPLRDIWIVSPPLGSEIWMHFFTVLFVLGFIIECGRSFISSYNHQLETLRELEAENEKTKAAYVAKSRFLDSISHELRTPLTSISGSLTMMKSGALGIVPEKMGAPLEIASRNAKRLDNLVDDLLLLQKGGAGKINFDFEVSDFALIAMQCVDAFRSAAAAKDMEIITNLELERYWVRVDSHRMGQVIDNILSNAAKFSENGGTIQVSMETHGEFARLLISDDGIGIPENARNAVFEEFQQVDTSSTRLHEGSGVGLSISKQIVDAHDGRIDFTSERGAGTTFFVDLHRVEAPDESS